MSHARPRALVVDSFPASAQIDSASLSELPSYFIGQNAEQLAEARQQILAHINVAHTAAEHPLAQALSVDRATIQVGYDAIAFDNRTQVMHTLHTDEHAQGGRQADNWRYKTKERLITSQVTCYGSTHTGIAPAAYKMILTTGCAINFMGSSSHDEQSFLEGHRVGRGQPGVMRFRDVAAVQAYHETMKKIFKRMLAAQDQAGAQVSIFPVIGGGVYLCQLADDEKDIARHQLFFAFVAALNESSFENIREVVYAIPDRLNRENNSVGEDFAYQEAKQIFARYTPSQENAPVLRLMNTSMFNVAEFYHAQGWRVGLINPGSDRTIGGDFKKTLLQSSSTGTVTGEELICNLTNAAYVQSVDYNQALQHPSNQVYKRFSGTYVEDISSVLADESPIAAAAASAATEAPRPYSGTPMRAAASAPYSGRATYGNGASSASQPYSRGLAAASSAPAASPYSSSLVSFPPPTTPPAYSAVGHVARRGAANVSPPRRSIASFSTEYDHDSDDDGLMLFREATSSSAAAAASPSTPSPKGGPKRK